VYLFLKELDLDRLPVRPQGEPAPSSPRTLALRNMVALRDALADRFWRDVESLAASPEARRALQGYIQTQVAAIESVCTDSGANPEALTGSSREVYGWLRFLADEENLALHVAALERSRAALAPRRALAPLAASVTVHLVPVKLLCRRRRYRNEVLLTVSEGFLHANAGVWEALIDFALQHRDPAGSARLRQFADSDEFAETLLEMEPQAHSAASAGRGCVHDLEASFARVNASHFNGDLPKPRLVWNGALTGRKFGHYRRTTDTVMISVSLDAPAVPEFVVDYVMYHELLHKKHRIQMVNGRRSIHTPSFRAEERRFARWAEAEALLQALAQKHSA